MSGFKDMIAEDVKKVFLNLNEYAANHTIIYDGTVYSGSEGKGIPIVLTGLKEQERAQLTSDHAQGLYRVSSVLHCAVDDLGGNQPEKGQRLKISEEGGGGFFREFYVAASICEMGMLRVELEAIDE